MSIKIDGASSSGDGSWLTALDRHATAWRRHRAWGGADALAALVYGLGIARNLDLLARVRADEHALGPVRSAAVARPAGVVLRQRARLTRGCGIRR